MARLVEVGSTGKLQDGRKAFVYDVESPSPTIFHTYSIGQNQHGEEILDPVTAGSTILNDISRWDRGRWPERRAVKALRRGCEFRNYDRNDINTEILSLHNRLN